MNFFFSLPHIVALTFMAVICQPVLSASISLENKLGGLSPGTSVSFANLGGTLELKEAPTPPDAPTHRGVRYFTTPNGDVVAMANRLLVEVRDPHTLKAVLALPQVQDHAALAHLEKTHIELLETSDVATALALLPTLVQMPGVVSAQPDLAQNVTRHGDRRYLDWKHFDLAKAIGLNDAWRLTQGQGVRIAVIDSGIDLQHPDLRGTQLLASFDVEQRTRNTTPKAANEGHGTLVAGLIFARHNGIGVDGVAPQAGLIDIRLMSGWASATVIGLQAAAQAGADIINCSWTFPLMLDPVAHLVDELVSRGRQGRGILLVVSAGNRLREIVRPDEFPAYPGLLTVTAVDHHGAPYGAAYGKGVFIAAPGMVRTTGPHFGGYEPLGGTSAAAALVSGTIALMLAVNPQLSHIQVRKLLTDTAEAIAPGEYSDRRKPLVGMGHLHAGRAVAAAAAAKKNKD